MAGRRAATRSTRANAEKPNTTPSRATEEMENSKGTFDEMATAARRSSDYGFLLKDFEKTFDVYLYHLKERNEAIRMFVMIAAAPFLALAFFGLTSSVSFANNSLIQAFKQLPSIFLAVFVGFGLVGLLPFHRFVAAQSNGYKMIRYLNNYRLFYFQLIAPELKTLQWTSSIEKDPRHPTTGWVRFHWASLFAWVMAIVNCAYVAVGVYIWDGKGSNVLMPVVAVLLLGLHALIAKGELQTGDIDRLEQAGVPIDDLLRQIYDRGNIE